MGKNYKLIIYGSIVANIILVGFCVFFITKNPSKSTAPDGNSSQYSFLSKRIFAKNQNDILVNFTPLRQAIKSYVSKNNNNIGVYFEYLPSGASINANGDLENKIASLIKIPTVMAIYKQVEDGKLSMDKKVTVTQADLDRGFGELWKKGAGTTLTLQEAVDLTLQQSDNTAHNLLKRYLNDEAALAELIDQFDIPLHEDDKQFIISPKNYTSILRSLYLSSYLKRENSQKILDSLTHTPFNDKIQAPIPKNIPVSHKIGTFNQNDNNSARVYSDCGIVYVPNRPFTLCVMTRGMSEDEAKQHMQKISKMSYEYIRLVN